MKLCLGVLTVILFFSLFAFNVAFAQNEEKQSVPITYDVKITLLDVGEVILKSGDYELRFLVTVRSEDVDFVELHKANTLPTFDFVNGYHDKDIVIEDLEEHLYSFEVDGKFFNEMDFHEYPFSTIHLKIMLEVEGMTADQVLLKKSLEPRHIEENSVFIPDWRIIHQVDYTEEIADDDGDINSRFTSVISIERPFLSNFLRSFLPIFVIVGIVVYNFWMDPFDGNSDKAALGSLLVLVFLHVGFLRGEIPSLEYLSIQDIIMIVSYVTITYVVIEHIFQRKFNKDGNKEKQIQINRKMFKILPLVMIVTFVIIYVPQKIMLGT